MVSISGWKARRYFSKMDYWTHKLCLVNPKDHLISGWQGSEKPGESLFKQISLLLPKIFTLEPLNYAVYVDDIENSSCGQASDLLRPASSSW